MAELKTKRTGASPTAFLNRITDQKKRKDAKTLLAIMRRITGEKAEMWGPSIIGFGHYRYQSPRTGRGGDWFVVGFSPRAQNLTVYCMAGLRPLAAQLRKLGKHKTGGGCLYFKTLDDIHQPTLEALIKVCLKEVARRERESGVAPV